MNRLHRRVLGRWKSLDWDGWWGDCVDVRFELARQLEEFRGKRILDVGCGHGVILAEADPSNFKVGVDDLLARLQMGRGICPDGRFIRANMLGLPFKNNSFDVILLGNIIELVEDKDAFLEQIKRLGTVDCQILATTPNLEHLAYRGHRNLSNIDELEKVFSLFSKVEICGYNSLPSLVSFLPRRLQGKIPNRWLRYLSLPSPMLVRMPGIERLLRFLMTRKCRQRQSKAFLIRAEI